MRPALVEESATTLLDYAPRTEPPTVTVSPSATAPSNVDITIVVSRAMDAPPADVARIVVVIPVDPEGGPPDPTNLVGIAPAAANPAIKSSGKDQWRAEQTELPGVFQFEPLQGQPIPVSQQSLTITITGLQVNTLVGTAVVTIREWAAQGGATPPDPDEDDPSGVFTIEVPKFPDGFYFHNLAASATAFAPGQTVTLTWECSHDAQISVQYGGRPAVQLDDGAQSWTSPALDDTTVFAVTAGATQNGQTVSKTKSVAAVVSSPKIVSFTATPAAIDYNQEVTLTWQTENADSVYLIGTGEPKKLPPASDPAHPEKIVPQYGGVYTLQAYQGTTASTPVSLVYAFNPLQIVCFEAAPLTLDVQHPATTLSWQVEHAMSVTLDGKAVPAQGSLQDSPAGTHTYELVATWVDGKSQQTQTINVTSLIPIVIGISHSGLHLNEENMHYVVTLVIDAEKATSAQVVNAYVSVGHGPPPNWPPANWPATSSAVAGVKIGDRSWQFVVEIPLAEPYSDHRESFWNWSQLNFGYQFTGDGGTLPVQNAQIMLMQDWKVVPPTVNDGGI